MLLKLAHHIIRHQAFCQIQMLRLKIKHKPCCRCWRFLHEVLHTADVHVCCFCVLPLRAIQAMCLFWAEALCSFPLCCPHTLWQAASCCLTSCPSDTNVPSAHQGVHNQLRERSPCSSLSLFFFFVPPSLCFTPSHTHRHTQSIYCDYFRIVMLVGPPHWSKRKCLNNFYASFRLVKNPT